MFIIMFSSDFTFPIPSVSNKMTRKNFTVVVDQFDAQEFNLNAAGWPQNTISQLARAQSKSEYDSIMARLVELKSEGSLPAGATLEESISSIKPRWAQSPNEIEQFVQMTNPSVMQKMNEAYEKSVKSSTEQSSVSSEAPASES